MERTGVFANAEEIEEIKKMHKNACETPAIMIHLVNGGPSAWAWRSLHDRITAIAKSHGLPDIPGEWGFDGQNGEFVKP